MIKIIKLGTLKEATCLKCGAVLSYDEKEDVQEEKSKEIVINGVGGLGARRKYITCPQCKNKIILSSTR